MNDNLIQFPSTKPPRPDPFGVDADARERGRRLMEVVTLPDGRQKRYGDLNLPELSTYVEEERAKAAAEAVAPIRRWSPDRRRVVDQMAAAAGMPLKEWLAQPVALPDGRHLTYGDLTHADLAALLAAAEAEMREEDVHFDAMIADLEMRAYGQGDKEALAVLSDPETIEARRLRATHP
jgi:hypothetical protein